MNLTPKYDETAKNHPSMSSMSMFQSTSSNRKKFPPSPIASPPFASKRLSYSPLPSKSSSTKTRTKAFMNSSNDRNIKNGNTSPQYYEKHQTEKAASSDNHNIRTTLNPEELSKKKKQPSLPLPTIDKFTFQAMLIEFDAFDSIPTLYQIAESIGQSQDVRMHHRSSTDNKHCHDNATSSTKLILMNERETNHLERIKINEITNAMKKLQSSKQCCQKVVSWDEFVKNQLQNVFDLSLVGHVLLEKKKDDINNVLHDTRKTIDSQSSSSSSHNNSSNAGSNAGSRKRNGILLGKNRKSKDKIPIKRSPMKSSSLSSTTNTTAIKASMKRGLRRNPPTNHHTISNKNDVEAYLEAINSARMKNGKKKWNVMSYIGATFADMRSRFIPIDSRKSKNNANIIECNDNDDLKQDHEDVIEKEDITLQFQRMQAKITTDEERKARFKELRESQRIDKVIMEREELEKEKNRLEEIEKARREEAAAKAASNLLRPLDKEEQNIVKKAIHGHGSPNDVLAETDNDSVLRKSMRTLSQGCWLNDEVIHYFYLMLSKRDEQLCINNNNKRSHFFKSFFLTKLFDEGGKEQYTYSNVKRWSKVRIHLL